MKYLRDPDPTSSTAAAPAPATRDRDWQPEVRDWYASSRDLAQGLTVIELAETLPAELRDLL